MKNKEISEKKAHKYQVHEKIARNYNFFGDEMRNLNDNITIVRGGSCAIGGDEWSKDYIVYYQTRWTIGFSLYATPDKAYVRIGKHYESGDLHDPVNQDELVKYLEDYSKLLLNIYDTCGKYFNVKCLSHLNMFFIDNLAVTVDHNGIITIKDLNDKTIIKTFNQVEQLVMDNDLTKLMSYYTRLKLWYYGI